jgi:hypothetical protein
MPDGQSFTYAHLVKKLHRACEQAAVPYERSKTAFNLFRRSLATYLMKQGGLMQAQAQLHHTSATTTASAYVCRDQTVVHDNAGVIESAFVMQPESGRIQ